MVDFNNETTIGTPASDVQKISILQRRYDFIEAHEDYKKKKLNNVTVSLNVLRARSESLFFEIQATLKRRLKPDVYNSLLGSLFNPKDYEDIRRVFFIINEFLDELKLTRIDTYKVYDSTDVDTEDKVKGF